ncbi:FG-GAP-like repeat-containing protein [Streptomyces roseoviridis]|uniref:FG-GAP-like repeat-containing protein n=1 Tax=Streptomyces roseoviridis TaxID=67361 RepID=A0ABV5QP06_9ACTN
MRLPLRRHLRAAAVLALVAAAVLPTAAPAGADAVDPGTAPPIRTLSYNVCGAKSDCRSALEVSDWTAEVREETLAWDTDALLLQELCFGQWKHLRNALPGYTGVWSASAHAPGCAKWDPEPAADDDPATAPDTRFGVGIFVKGAAVDRHAAYLPTATGMEKRQVLCARGPVDGRATLVCTTHLAQHQYKEPTNGDVALLAQVDTWAAGLPVILGGDFNHRPESTELDGIRAGLPGTGPFAEADENDTDWFSQTCRDAGAATCRTGEPTTVVRTEADPEGTPAKFDHVFLSSRDFHTVRADALEPGAAGTAPLSDHLLLRTAAHPEARPAGGVGGDLTDDCRPDFLAVTGDGDLRLHSGIGSGTLGDTRRIGTGGWTGAAVSHRGDWTGDGREDVVARIGDDLWVYPNKGSGELGPRVAMGGRPSGWTGATPSAAGDVDGDRLPDVLARSSTGLWLHRGGAAAGGAPTFAAKAALQIGGPEWAGYDVILPGDVTGDGRADVWGRDRATGEIRQYASRGATTLAAPVALTGGPWTVAERRLGVSAGDVTGDGLPDLWTTRTADSAENLELLPGTPTGLAGPTTVATGGWQGITSLG